MNSQWQIDLFDGLNDAVGMQDVLDATVKIIKPFGFDYAGWRTALPIPMAKRKILVMNTAEDEVLRKAENGGYDDAPGVKHCSKSMDPIYCKGTTNEPLFFKAPELWEEYYGFGRKACWAQSLIESESLFSMFWVDSSNQMTQRDIDNIYFKMQWVSISVLSKMSQFKIKSHIKLSEREKEILRWFRDGKTADQVGKILNLSHSTINFHMRNTMLKLDVPNKTSAIIKAIYLGLLN